MHTELFASGEVAFFQRFARYGYSPKVIYDIGASNGSWSREIAEIFPDADFHLFEPLSGHSPKYDEGMRATLATHAKFTLHSIALGNESGGATMHVTEDSVGSSLHPMPSSMAKRIEVPCWRLDEYAAKCALPAPNVVKMDVQGFEAFVLEGAGSLIDGADLLFLETWLTRGYGPNTPLLTELVQALSPLGFVLVEICGPYYGEYRELTAVDGFFVSKRLMKQIKEASGGWKW